MHKALYAIGDLQGCSGSFTRLLAELPADAELRFVGDLVNRGPDSATTLRMVRSLGPRAKAVLGNHDIHLLAVAAGVRKPGKSDTLGELLRTPDSEELLTWLRHRPLAIYENGFLIVHAGILPQWTVAQTLELAREVEQALRGENWRSYLADIFGNTDDRWHDGLRGVGRHRVVINALTRLRFCTRDGVIDFKTKEGLSGAPAGLLPWFDVPGRRTEDVTVVCGHWSTLGLVMRPNLMALDTGCVWGGQLTAALLAAEPSERRVIQVSCPQYCNPVA
jgi:bis(5'-nucleosyl)-tetraphosphatase (symmetrical)